jgi:hypothetical protein
LFDATRRVRAQRKSLSELHADQYAYGRSPPLPDFIGADP